MKREYGIDLLKMLAMVMVVCHHILLGGGVSAKLHENGGGGAHFEQVFHCFCYCAVDCFVMATGYIMCRHAFKYVRIFKLWRQVVGYSLALVAIAWITLPSGAVCWRDWIGAMMPITFNRYWFFTEYAALFFCIPFLNKMLSVLTERERGVLIVTGFCILSLMPFVAGIDLFVIKWGYSFVWFLYLYLLGACLAVGDFRTRISTGWLVLALVAGVLGSACGTIVAPILSAHFGGGARLEELAWSYASPTLLLEAVALVLLFSKVDVRNVYLQKILGIIAPCTFIVYVVHSNDAFRRIVGWKTCFLGLVTGGEWCVIFGTIMFAIAIFAAIVLVDVIRRAIFKAGARVLNHGND